MANRSSAGKVQIVEVGPRDGLQNESSTLDISTRLSFAQRLATAGLKRIEVGAFVSPEWVPQMAGSGKLLKKLNEFQKNGKISSSVKFSSLVPNERGMQDAIQSGVKEIAIFAAASESFSQKNINCTVKESLKRFEPVMDLAKKRKIKVRGYLSTCFGCPYEGKVSQSRVLKVSEQLLEMGIFELSIGDTIGVADPKSVKKLVAQLVQAYGEKKIAMHFHDTRGTALANILASLDLGIRTFDTSLGGLGGCPYAPGASGNVATEDVVYMLEKMGLKTGISIEELIKINHWMKTRVQHDLPSRVSKAGLPKV